MIEIIRLNITSIAPKAKFLVLTIDQYF